MDTINLNDSILVELSSFGIFILQSHYERLFDGSTFAGLSIEEWAERHHKGSNKYEFQIYEFALIFGKQISRSVNNFYVGYRKMT